MGKKADHVFDELYDGYQALASVILTDEWERARLIAYLNGYADAMSHASWALEEERPRLKRLFYLLPSRKLRKAVRASSGRVSTCMSRVGRSGQHGSSRPS